MLTPRQLYKQELVRCRKHFERIDLAKERGYLMKFTTFSANVENILPSIPRRDHETLFHELLLQEIFTTFDQQYLSALDLVKLQGNHTMITKPDGPKIYCTYHLGSFRLLTGVLFKQGVDCVLMVGSNMKRNQGEAIQTQIDKLRQKFGYTNSFRIIESGSASAGLTVLRELKAGKSLIVYVDGSPETGPEEGQENQFLTVRFGQHRVLTRKGVGYLSHAAGVPIVPVVAYRQPDMTNVLHCLKSIRPIPQSDREMYCQEAMQQLYDGFWPFLKQYPGQWEGWNYIHLFLKPEAIKTHFMGYPLKRLTFNDSRYSICDLEECPILFDRRLYQTFEITEDLRDLLLNINQVESVEETVGQEVFSELMTMEILH